MTQHDPAPRRTQQSRRENTVAKLIEGTIEAIGDVGYARTTIQEITRRAGLSHGGLFRHFDTRLDVIVAAAEEAGHRQVREVTSRLTGATVDLTDVGSIVQLLQLLRSATRSPTSAVWYELVVAARTDDELRIRLAPTVERYGAEIAAAALSIPVRKELTEHTRLGLLFTALSTFDGEAIFAPVFLPAELAEQRLRLLAEFIRHIAATS
ncbi:TetR/AcrR family transcriptional regulator [Amycolatopsis nigrescens]|uniref:TetR/AcrR family transcriptional regulator n=1 Tax=Amycolatopsis nigrescens TaxID=381445 RepID=UPI00036B625D|nr:TetR/AcrR family transcriptional regulator [Amycolatopsis nigrescens]